jgi:hypothetical protein
VEARVGRLEALRAGRVLFGPSFAGAALAGAAWRRLLKTTFRRRALETHPDRAQALGRSEADLAREFDAVRAAYGLLSTLAAPPPSASPRPSTASRPATARPAAPPASPPRAARARARAEPDGASRAARPLPARRLRLAEFLYYSGRVPWSAFVDAVAWQRAQRPALGRIAVEMGFLTAADVADLLALRRAEGALGVPIGEWAVRRGALAEIERLAALGRQARRQRRIGAFFVERGMVSAEALDQARHAMDGHNARYPRQ